MSGNQSKPIVAWDSCIWLGWFNNEPDKPLNDVQLVLQEVENGDCCLLVSALSYTEVLNLTENQAGSLFREYVRRPNILRVDVDFRIADKAGEIRENSHRINERDNSVAKIKTPDAIIIATALIYKADVLHTFDPKILNVSEHGVVEGLKITTPKTLKGQKPLPFEEK